MSLATEARPKSFDEVVGQQSTIEVLKRQLLLHKYSNCYLFVGKSGTGKTTIGRLLANEINHGIGSPIEIDAASNNGVDNVRAIMQSASERSVDGSEYKIFIIDEVQAITSAGWQAFLKGIEEVPKYTIFIFCTTEEQKIPATIKNRCMRFFFSHIPLELIVKRLHEVCTKYSINATDEALKYIATLASGCMREALSLLEKASIFSDNITIDTASAALGEFTYTSFFNLTNAIIDKNTGYILDFIDNLYNNGKDLKLFINQYLAFTLDLNKYKLYNNINLTDIPASLEFIEQDSHCVKYITDYTTAEWLNNLVNNILDIKNAIRVDTAYKSTIKVMLVNCALGK